MISIHRTAVYVAALILSWTGIQAQVRQSAPPHIEHIKVVLVGDSTVATEGGWGPGFCAHLTDDADCLDLAADGRSTKSFLDEGLWRKALDEGGQFYFIQFGHNDQKDQVKLHTDPETTFKANLHRYVRDARVDNLVDATELRQWKTYHRSFARVCCRDAGGGSGGSYSVN